MEAYPASPVNVVLAVDYANTGRLDTHNPQELSGRGHRGSKELATTTVLAKE